MILSGTDATHSTSSVVAACLIPPLSTCKAYTRHRINIKRNTPHTHNNLLAPTRAFSRTGDHDRSREAPIIRDTPRHHRVSSEIMRMSHCTPYNVKAYVQLNPRACLMLVLSVFAFGAPHQESTQQMTITMTTAALVSSCCYILHAVCRLVNNTFGAYSFRLKQLRTPRNDIEIKKDWAPPSLYE